MEFAQAAAGLGLRAIHGAEMALEDDRHVTLLVEDASGWRNPCPLLTGGPRARRARERVPAGAAVGKLKGIFGPEHLRVELQRPFHRDDRARNRALAERAERVGVPTVATGNVHAHARSRAVLQDP